MPHGTNNFSRSKWSLAPGFAVHTGAPTDQLEAYMERGEGKDNLRLTKK
jgi:hypothetical protein